MRSLSWLCFYPKLLAGLLAMLLLMQAGCIRDYDDFAGATDTRKDQLADARAESDLTTLDICVPQCSDKECADNGCSGLCGECGANETCSADGKCKCPSGIGCMGACCQENHVCGTDDACCMPDCGETFCGMDGCGTRQCGTNGCGASCGTCNQSSFCDAGACLPWCGNGDCDNGETCETCPGDCSSCSGVTPGFVKINAGSFWMGSPSNCPGPSGYPGDCTSELGRDSDETLHYVKLTGDFEMQIHEVTQGEWKAAFGGWNPAGSTNGDSYPIETVSWFDACAYANYRSEQAALTPCYVFSEVKCEGGVEVGSNYKECLNGTQKGIDGGSVTLAGGAAKPYACEGYRLLTEAEWEYAARAGSTTALYPSAGNNGSLTVAGNVCTPLDPNLDKIGWHCGNTSATEAVGGKAANNWGLKDMSGNIWEWCSDWTNHPMTYGNGTSGAADEDPHGESGSSRVFRGGSWIDYAGSCRSANRYGNPPGNRDLNLGFRVARSL